MDFGETLRCAAHGGLSGLSDDDRRIVSSALASGRLLTDAEFAVAEKILRSFVAARLSRPGDIVVLNGLPRHRGQATGIEPVVDVRLVVYLKATPAVVRERISTNAGGDRTGRTDDGVDAVERKLLVFERETIPLLDHYRGNGVALLGIDVRTASTPAGLLAQMEKLAGSVLEES
jgi:adenylate kinase family enzyme